jgi:large subunit ribosomal protein L44e
MKYPGEKKSYCPHCRKHTLCKVKEAKKGKTRTMARGQLRHIKKTKGYVSKIAGKTKIKKQSKHIKFVFSCPECKKKHEKTTKRRFKKKIEIQKK